jgi:hypothetical protein
VESNRSTSYSMLKSSNRCAAASTADVGATISEIPQRNQPDVTHCAVDKRGWRQCRPTPVR